MKPVCINVYSNCTEISKEEINEYPANFSGFEA